MDNMFDEFVAQPEDELNPRNEFAEALEDRGRDREAEDEKGPHDLVADS